MGDGNDEVGLGKGEGDGGSNLSWGEWEVGDEEGR